MPSTCCQCHALRKHMSQLLRIIFCLLLTRCSDRKTQIKISQVWTTWILCQWRPTTFIPQAGLKAYKLGSKLESLQTASYTLSISTFACAGSPMLFQLLRLVRTRVHQLGLRFARLHLCVLLLLSREALPTMHQITFQSHRSQSQKKFK